MQRKFMKLFTLLGALVLMLAYQNCGKLSSQVAANSQLSSQVPEGTTDETESTESTVVDVCPDFPSKGYVACFYDDTTLTRLASMSSFSSVAANYDGVTAPSLNVSPTGFSALWKGLITTQAGDYDLTVLADDGVRVSIDDVLVIDQWQDRYPASFTVRKKLTSGSHKVEIKYYNGKGGGTLGFETKAVVAGTPLPPPPSSTPTPPPAQTPVPPTQQAFVGQVISYYGPAEFQSQASSFNYEHLRLSGGQGQVGPFWLHKGSDSNLQAISTPDGYRLKMQIRDGVKWQGYNYDRTEMAYRTDIEHGFLNPDITYVIDWKGHFEAPLPTLNGHMTAILNSHGQDKLSGPHGISIVGDDLVYLDSRDPRGTQRYIIGKHRDFVTNSLHLRLFWKAHDTNGYLRVEINGKVLMERKGGQTKNAGGWNYFKFGGLYDYDRRLVAPYNTSNNHYATITEFFRYGRL